MITEIREWIAFVVECLILLVVWMEYVYDKSKDDVKKNKKTKTTKTTKSTPEGTVTEEHTETTEERGK